MYKKFNNPYYAHYGIWLKNEKNEVVLITNEELKKTDFFLSRLLVNNGLSEIDAFQIVKEVRKND